MNKIYHGDCLEVLKTLPSESVDCVVTSPPYWALRDYGVTGQIGLEPKYQEYILKLCNIFDEVKRVLKKEGTCWVNIGDTYMGNSSYYKKGRQGFGNDKIRMINKKQWQDPKYLSAGDSRLRAREHIASNEIREKSLCQIPSRFAIEMINRGWILRNEIIWHKPNCMPSSVKDRFTVDFEKVFFFVKNKKYYFEQQLEKSIWAEIDKRAVTGGITKSGKSISENGRQYQISKSGSFRKDKMRNVRSVWTINTKGLKEAHFATYPEALIEPMIRAGCPSSGIVLDPFFGAGTTGLVARKQDKNYIGIELNEEYIKIAEARINSVPNKLF